MLYPLSPFWTTTTAALPQL